MLKHKLQKFNYESKYNLENKIPDVSALIQTNQSNVDKQNFEKKNLKCWWKVFKNWRSG